MDDETRRNLSAIWLSNEAKIEDAKNLRAGAEPPAERIGRLDSEQDEIEWELGSDYLRRTRDELAEDEPTTPT